MKRTTLFLILIFSFTLLGGCIKEDNYCFRVTYDLASPDAQGDSPVDASRYSENDIVLVLDTDAVRPGFTFTGWNTRADGSGDTRLPGETFIITGNITLYAQWELATVEITYLNNGGVGDPFTDTSIAGEPYTFLNSEQSGISRSGFGLASWNTAADGNGILFLPEQSVAVEEDLILYAQWLPIVTAGITFNPNGAAATPYTYYVPLNSSFTIPTTEELGFSRPGYIFLGWNTQSNGTGAAYQPGNVIEVAGALNLYARWFIPI